VLSRPSRPENGGLIVTGSALAQSEGSERPAGEFSDRLIRIFDSDVGKVDDLLVSATR
jgi:hypothetical protein